MNVSVIYFLFLQFNCDELIWLRLRAWVRFIILNIYILFVFLCWVIVTSHYWKGSYSCALQMTAIRTIFQGRALYQFKLFLPLKHNFLECFPSYLRLKFIFKPSILITKSFTCRPALPCFDKELLSLRW